MAPLAQEKLKLKVQFVVISISVMIFIAKIWAYYLTNSVGILSDALESTVNVIAGIATFFSLKYSFKPRDKDHPYGHGKIELITASIEGVLIGMAGILIILEAFKRIFIASEIKELEWGLILVAIAGIINYILAMYSINIGKKYNSMALVASGQHLKTDTYTSIGLIGGLILLHYTRISWIDSVIAGIFGFFILKAAYTILKSTITGLMDEADLKSLAHIGERIATNRKTEWIYIHKLTYLKFGHISHLDLHLTLPYYFNLKESEIEVKKIKRLILQDLVESDVDISIQAEPCTFDMCGNCKMVCPVRQHPFTEELDWNLEMLTQVNFYNK